VVNVLRYPTDPLRLRRRSAMPTSRYFQRTAARLNSIGNGTSFSRKMLNSNKKSHPKS